MMNLRQPDNPGLPILPLIGPLANAACRPHVLVLSLSDDTGPGAAASFALHERMIP